MQYFGIPLSAKYNLTAGKLTFSPGIGISANILNKGTIETSIATSGGHERARSNEIQGLKQAYFSGSLSAGVSYNLSKNIAVSFTPIARFALSSITKNAPVKTYLNSVGLVTGLTFKL